MKRLVLILVYVTATGPFTTHAQDAARQTTRTVWDGVFTAEQAARGKTSYEATCNRCHGPITASSPWIGLDDFMDRWREDSAQSFFTFLKTSMPPQRGRAPRPVLSDDTYVDIITYILAANGLPPGSRELTAGLLDVTRVEGKDGPKPLPHGALAIVVGCLQRLNATTWILSMATEPVRTRSEESTDAEVKAAQNTKLGGLTFRLQNLEWVGDKFDPEMHEGHRIHIKGSLIRQPNAERIDVRSLVVAAATCP
jgi:cytochrome c5